MPLSLPLPIQVDAGVGVWTGVGAGKRQGVWGQWGLSMVVANRRDSYISRIWG